MASHYFARKSSSSADEPPDPSKIGDIYSNLQLNPNAKQRSRFYYSATSTISTKSSEPSETDSTKRDSSDEPEYSDTSAAAMLSAFQCDSKEDTTSSRCIATVSSTSSSSAKKSDTTTVSDPLGLLGQSEHIASAAARSAADASRERVSRTKKRRPEKSEEELRKERLAANRRSAAASRQRRKILIEELQNSVASLVKENAGLRRENEDLKEQVKHLREENRQLADSRRDERESGDSPVTTTINNPSHQAANLLDQSTVGGDQSSQSDTTPSAMAGLGIDFGNVGSALPRQGSSTTSLTAIGNGSIQGSSFMGLLGSLDFSQSNVAGANAVFPSISTTAQQLPQHPQTGVSGFSPLLAQVNNAQINQELLRKYPPHVLQILLARQQR